MAGCDKRTREQIERDATLDIFSQAVEQYEEQNIQYVKVPNDCNEYQVEFMPEFNLEANGSSGFLPESQIFTSQRDIEKGIFPPILLPDGLEIIIV